MRQGVEKSKSWRAKQGVKQNERGQNKKGGKGELEKKRAKERGRIKEK